MNKILQNVQDIIKSNMAQFLPNVSSAALEDGGTVYYMNGRNGTKFDFFVNDRLSTFMVFYQNEENLGAAKASLYADGRMLLYLYDDGGKHVAKEITARLEVTKEDMLRLAVILKNNADDKRIWDSALEKLNTDDEPSDQMVSEFLNHRQYYEPTIRRMEMTGKLAVVSKRITEGGWRVGYMVRENPRDERDSGWQFMVGNEDDAYINDVNNLVLCMVGSIYQIDPAILTYIDSPPQTYLVRVSRDKFEEDKGQEPYIEKWKNGESI